MTSVLQCVDLCKSYDEGPEPVHVLENIHFSLQTAERVAIVGASGSGKSTLLNLLGGLDQPSRGEVRLSDQAFSSLSPNARGQMRNRHMGFVYQFHHLLPEFSALENVAMPLMISGQSLSKAKGPAADMLDKVGLSERMTHRPSALSGGERQRVAIARALVNRPECVLMDEPTGNLDAETAAEIESLMEHLNKQLGISFVLVTHDQALASRMDRVLKLERRQLQRVETL
ncbi:lipoprotein-releasing ABC transporter ATP-binding protein LolD [Pseudoteredinibacter isoporae]|uniref:lipoprotein-releasing ABC transporter ATP-binding protein LolD n=1 Tax=Pseudoteredinibacter isoporae TaxID=570281 RepID=UPI003107EDEE